jgi:sulfite reductase (NADPH) flavoprotein alpha-component
MKISFWRYIHLFLAVSSSVFILLASVTGIILAFEPIEEQWSSKTVDISEISVAETIENLQKEHKSVVSLSVNHHNQVKASVVTKEGKNATYFVNPNTGKDIQKPGKRSPIFKFATTLHRSLFLKSTGRFLVGLFSFFLLVISITGVSLILKKEGGFKQWFTINNTENLYPKYHTFFGKWLLIPIVIITFSGVYLSLDKFNVFPKEKLKHNYELPNENSSPLILITESDVLQQTALSDLVKLEFPFSEDEEDFFFIELKDKELYIHQYTGKVISDQSFSGLHALKYWSLKLHTGHGYLIWSFILILSCFGILFFMFSGFKITLKRRSQKEKIKNKYKKDSSEIILLVGSETGSTLAMAKSFHKALLKAKQKSFLTSINKLKSFPKAKHVILLSATYGDGDPPANATKFFKLIKQYPFSESVKFSVVGFGSLAYKKYCEFAIQIDDYLNEDQIGQALIPLKKINNKSFTSFKAWQEEWSKQSGIRLELEAPKVKIKKQIEFKVVDKSELKQDDTFTIQLQPQKKKSFTSGDLLSIIPNKDQVERLYSIGRLNGNLVLSIKKHEFGVCSNLLNNLKIGESLKASIHKNKSFHLPKRKKPVVLIANGTGIAPFLGMINDPKHQGEKHLFWGCKTKASTEIYNDILNQSHLTTQNMAFSRESESLYVQNVIKTSPKIICKTLSEGGTIMICGSITMMNGVMEVLEEITQYYLQKSISDFKEKGQVRLDCY